MRKQSVLAQQNLVSNGSFGELLTGWTVQPTNSPWVQVEQQEYNGGPINTLSLGNAASVSQDIIAPLDPGVNADYVLKFLCESRHTETGWVRIANDGMPLLEIEIPPGRQRNAGQPLAFLPKEYCVELEPAFSADAILTFSVTSASSAPDAYGLLLYITSISIEVRLPPLELQAFTLDGESHPPTALVPLCVGAQGLEMHQLGFDVAAGNSWLGTHYSLALDGNPQQAIVAAPDWSVDHPLDGQRSLGCPPLDLPTPHLMKLTLFNQYSAKPYELAASLWHHRLKFLQVQEAAYFPVLEYNESVELGVQVASFYTDATLEGLTVTWTVAQTSTQAVTVTDAGGWVYFSFKPETAGTYTVAACVPSLFYASGVVTQSFEVRVLDTDPWKEVEAVVADQASPWSLKTGWPNRGSAYPLLVTVPEVLVGSYLSLEWEGDPQEQLKVDVSPALTQYLPITDTRELLWTLTSGDEMDGRFELRLMCSKLLNPSPYKSMRLARNEIEIGRVREADKTCVVDEAESATIQLEVLHLVEGGSGDPVQGALVKWLLPDQTSVDSVSGAGGWTSVAYQPTSAGNHSVGVIIQAHPDAVPIERTFVIKAIATSPWKNHVRFFLDDVEVERNTLGLLCRRGQSNILKVLPKDASPWIGKNISVHWRNADPVIGLSISELGSSRTLLAEGVEWTLSSVAGTSQSRPFEVEFHLEGESSVRELTGRLLHLDTRQELSLLLDQVSAHLTGQGLYPCRGAAHLFTVLPNALSPLLGLEVLVEWTGTPADQLGATVTPALDRPQYLDAGGVSWGLDFISAIAGQFNLTVSMPQLNFVATASPMMLDHNKLRLMALRGPAIDPVIGLDKAWVWARVISHFTGEPVASAPVTWEAEGKSIEVETDAEGVSSFAYEPTTPGVHPVTGSILSLFDNFEESRSTQAEALAVDPWEEMVSAFDESDSHLLGTKTYFPRRAAEHLLEVSAPVGNALIGRTLTLGMSGDGPAALGFAFAPANTLGLAQVFQGTLQYPFSVKDLKDGSCALRLGAERLARLSPPMHMSVGQRTHVLKIAERQRLDQTLSWGEAVTEQITVVSTVSGKPMVGITVIWRSPDLGEVTTTTNFYGVARVRFVPVTPGAFELTATAGDALSSESVSLPFFLNQPQKIHSLTSPKPSGHLGELVSAVVNVVSALTGEPLQDVEVEWEYPDRILPPARTDIDGNARVQFRLAGIRRALLQATVKGGFAGWQARYLEFVLVPN